MSPEQTRASRRQFLKVLAGSPLLALAYPGLPEKLQRLLPQHDASTGVLHAASHRPSGVPCPDCGMEMVYPVDPGLYLRRARPPETDEHQLIDTLDEAINVWDFEKVLHSSNLSEHWDYLRGGIDDDATILANRLGFQKIQLRMPRLQRGSHNPIPVDRDRTDAPTAPTAGAMRAGGGLDMRESLYGKTYNSPLFLCPVAALRAYHTDGEAGAGAAAQRTGHLLMQSHVSSHSYEEIADSYGAPHYFQLYADRDWTRTHNVLKRVEAAGCEVLVWTIDLLGGSNRETLRRTLGTERYDQPLCQECHEHQPGYERPMRRNLGGGGPMTDFDWDYVKRLKDNTNMKVVLKGIVTEEEAALSVEYGADGVYVSNHGGRAEESLRSTIEDLPGVVRGVNGRVPIMIDSGFRRGTDIFKALAMGADMVGVGRPYVWGLGAFGIDGVEKVIQLLDAELEIVLRQAGVSQLSQVTDRFVEDRDAPIIRRASSFGRT